MEKRGERESIGRKGLSPLIATILLISFAVAVGTMIMTWSLGSAEPENPCLNVAIELQQVAGGSAMCYDTQNQALKFLVKNVGPDTVEYLKLSVVDSQFDTQEKTLNPNLESGRSTKVELPYKTLSPNDIAAEIVPVVIVEDQEHICVDTTIEQSSIEFC